MQVLTLALAIIAADTSQPAAPRTTVSEWARLDFDYVPAVLRRQSDKPDTVKPSVGEFTPFGTRDTWRWTVLGGAAIQFSDHENTFVLGGVGASFFVLDNLAIVNEINLLFVSQNGNDAVGFNWNLLGRWHFLAEKDWTVYLDGGAGVIINTEPVPGRSDDEPLGSGSFAFTPQIGVGMTWRLREQNRLMAGVRWHHISNGRTRDVNPPRDSLLVYMGISLPF